MIKVGIVGGTGYTGVELLRLLAMHPGVSLQCVTSRSESGRLVSDLYPNLRGHLDLPFSNPDINQLSKCDVVFFATPNGVAMQSTDKLLNAGVKVIDLAADFRIKDLELWSRWYGMEHACPDRVAEAVYGLPEVNREKIRSAQLVACPGCYPTAVQLGFLPLLEHGLVNTDFLIADVKSGVSGAGRQANVGTLLCEASESLKAYGVAGHRHLPEITQGLEEVSENPVGLTFVPHLTPMIRGIHGTLYAVLKPKITHNEQDIYEIFREFYRNEPFVDVMPLGSEPETRSVKGANTCRLAVYKPANAQTIVVLSVIDNLVKGAAGQAVQNLNLMFGLDESEGLRQVALLP